MSVERVSGEWKIAENEMRALLKENNITHIDALLAMTSLVSQLKAFVYKIRKFDEFANSEYYHGDETLEPLKLAFHFEERLTKKTSGANPTGKP